MRSPAGGEMAVMTVSEPASRAVTRPSAVTMTAGSRVIGRLNAYFGAAPCLSSSCTWPLIVVIAWTAVWLPLMSVAIHLIV